MGKRAKARTPIVSRKAVSRSRREERYRRWLYAGAGVVLGLYQSWVVAPASPVATVIGVPIRSDTYQRWVQSQRYNIRNYLARIDAQLAQLDPKDESQLTLAAYFQQQREQLQAQSMNLPLNVLNALIDDELIRQEAARRGIAVTPEEVQAEIERYFGYQVEQPTAIPTTPGATSPITTTPTPTPVPMSEEAFREHYSNMLRELRQNAGFTEADFRAMVATDLLRGKLEEAMAAEVPGAAEQVHARHILVATEEEARAALERIRKGEDFAAVAQEVSTDASNKEEGGDLGWFPRGQMVAEFEQAAFALQPGEVSDLVATDYGYHLIKVEERDPNRPLDAGLLDYMRSRALANWLSQQRNSEAVQRFWSSDKVPKD